MYHRASELKHIFNENMKGGTGTVEIIRSVNPIDYESPAKMIAKLILRPGCSLGKHMHEGEEEIITILTGHAAYDDNRTIASAKAESPTALQMLLQKKISFSLLSLTILPNYRQNKHQSHWRFPVQSESDKSPLPCWNLRWDLSYIPFLQSLPARYSS